MISRNNSRKNIFSNYLDYIKLVKKGFFIERVLSQYDKNVQCVAANPK